MVPHSEDSILEGQPKKKSKKGSDDGLSSGDEEDPALAEEASLEWQQPWQVHTPGPWVHETTYQTSEKDTPASVSI